VIAIDVGGTSIKAARTDGSGAVLDRRSVPTPVHDGADAVVGTIRSVARELVDHDVQAVGVVVPGEVDDANGIAAFAANLGWRDVPLRAHLEVDLGLPVVLDNDARAAGLAERTLGRARDVPDCLIVVIGTGIAAVVVAGGVPLRGAAGLAGELGHVSVRPEGEQCACGQRGCAERYASGAAIARRYAERTGTVRAAEDVAARLVSDDAAAQVWAEAAGALGAVLAATTLVVDPSLIVLGGGLARAGETLRSPVQAALAAHLGWRAAPEVVMSPLAADAGVLGAALLAWQAAGGPARGG
jgi:glucokinase